MCDWIPCGETPTDDLVNVTMRRHSNSFNDNCLSTRNISQHSVKTLSNRWNAIAWRFGNWFASELDPIGFDLQKRWQISIHISLACNNGVAIISAIDCAAISPQTCTHASNCKLSLISLSLTNVPNPYICIRPHFMQFNLYVYCSWIFAFLSSAAALCVFFSEVVLLNFIFHANCARHITDLRI